MLVFLAADELDSLLNIADEGESLTSVLYLTLAASAFLNMLLNPILGVIVAGGLCTGKPLLSFCSEGDVFPGFDFIFRFLYQLQKFVPVLRRDDAAVDGFLEFLLLVRTSFCCGVLFVIHAFAL